MLGGLVTQRTECTKHPRTGGTAAAFADGSMTWKRVTNALVGVSPRPRLRTGGVIPCEGNVRAVLDLEGLWAARVRTMSGGRAGAVDDR